MSSAISALDNPAVNTTPQANNNNALAELDTLEFIEILITELSNQDPLAPNDSQALIEQIGSIREIEASLALEDNIAALVEQNAVSQAAQLLGREVRGFDSGFNEVTGPVTGVLIEDGKAVLRLGDNTRVPYEQVTELLDSQDIDDAITQQLLANLAVLDSSSLIGKYVTGLDAAGLDIAGRVNTVRLQPDGSIDLTLESGQSLPIGGVTSFGDGPGDTVAVVDDEEAA